MDEYIGLEATMSLTQYLRAFISERLTAAAEEILGVFEKSINQYEEEISRQRKLLDIAWKPDIKLHSIDFPQQHVHTKDLHTDQQLCTQERNFIPEVEEPGPTQIKEEPKELCTSQDGEQLILKQETDAFMLTPAYESNNDQLLSHNSLVAESQDQKEMNHLDSRSIGKAEPKKRHQKPRSHCNSDTGETSLTCEVCAKTFKYKSQMKTHLRSHTGEKPYACNTCGKKFFQLYFMKCHERSHTDERPYSCETCGKSFRRGEYLLVHKRTHTGEKPYFCNTCGKRFSAVSSLKSHRRIHTEDKPIPCQMDTKRCDSVTVRTKTRKEEKRYSCKTCGKCFTRNGNLLSHLRIHTGEKPYPCNKCERRFKDPSALKYHIRAHTGVKPYSCVTCEKKFVCLSNLNNHMRTHKSENSPETSMGNQA